MVTFSWMEYRGSSFFCSKSQFISCSPTVEQLQLPLTTLTIDFAVHQWIDSKMWMGKSKLELKYSFKKKIFQMPMSRVFSLMSRRLAELIRHFPNYLDQQKFLFSKLGFLRHNLFTGNVNVMSLKHCRDWLTHQYNSQKTKMSNWVKVTNSKLW